VDTGELPAKIPGTADRHQHERTGAATIKGGGGIFGHDAVGRALRFDDAAEVGVALYDANHFFAETIEQGGRRCDPHCGGSRLVGLGLLHLPRRSRRVSNGVFKRDRGAKEEARTGMPKEQDGRAVAILPRPIAGARPLGLVATFEPLEASSLGSQRH
jgi:hypothetical protein